jgi:hypothetical protein
MLYTENEECKGYGKYSNYKNEGGISCRDWKEKERIHKDIEQIITEHYQKLRLSDSSSVPQKMM